MHNKSIANKRQRHRQRTQTQNKKTMASLEDHWTQLQKHNFKKRVIKKASHCLCDLVSIGRETDQLCTANCLTSKFYHNNLDPGGQRLRPHPGHLPSNQAQFPLSKCSGNQSCEAECFSSRCKPAINLLEMQRICRHVGSGTKKIAWTGEDRNKKITCRRIFYEAVMPCSRWLYWF